MSRNDTPVSAPAGPVASSLSHETVVEMLSTLSDEATHPFTLRSLRENDAALRAALAAAERELAEFSAILARHNHEWSDRCEEAESRLAAATALVRAMREESGVEFEDERVRYVAVHIDRGVWDEASAFLAAQGGEVTR